MSFELRFASLYRPDRSDGSVPEDDETHHPSAAEVMRYFDCLDGRTFDQLLVEIDSERGATSIEAEGDARSDMSVTIFLGSEVFKLVNPDGDDRVGWVMSGGSRWERPSRFVVPGDVARLGVETYVTVCRLDARLEWMKMVKGQNW